MAALLDSSGQGGARAAAAAIMIPRVELTGAELPTMIAGEPSVHQCVQHAVPVVLVHLATFSFSRAPICWSN